MADGKILNKAREMIKNLTDTLSFPPDKNGYSWRSAIGHDGEGVHLYVREITPAIIEAIPKSVEVDGTMVQVLLQQTGKQKACTQDV